MAYSALIDRLYSKIIEILSEMGRGKLDFSVTLSRPGFGDLSCNVAFLAAKAEGVRPSEIAGEIAHRYSDRPDAHAPRAEAHPSGYLNFFLDHALMNETVIRESISDGYGMIDAGSRTRVTIEHTSVNPNKALHVGHVRNVVIGDSVARILSRAGFEVKVLNYIDDSGLQVADIILGFQEIGFPLDPPDGRKFDHYCGDEVYTKTTERYPKDPALETRREEILREIEEGSSETARLAENVTRRVLASQLETCQRLGASYDCLNFESHILRTGLWSDVFEKLKQKKLTWCETEGDNAGCWMIQGEQKGDTKVLVRSNGTATYLAKDVPYAAWKLGLVSDPFHYTQRESDQPGGRILWETSLYDAGEPRQDCTGEKVITVIDSRQGRLQRMISDLISRLGQGKGAYVHLSYESVALSPATAAALGAEGTGRRTQMSGRKGLYVSADTVLELLADKARVETAKRNPDLDEERTGRIAREIAVAAIRYEMIKQDLDKVITFDMEKSLSLEGDTAPYLQYSYARAVRVMEKAARIPDFDAEYDLLVGRRELDLIRLIGVFDMRVRDASANLSPKTLARYCRDLAVAFNGFYEESRILGLESFELTNARLCLVSSFMSTFEKALDFIGISAPSRM